MKTDNILYRYVYEYEGYRLDTPQNIDAYNKASNAGNQHILMGVGLLLLSFVVAGLGIVFPFLMYPAGIMLILALVLATSGNTTEQNELNKLGKIKKHFQVDLTTEGVQVRIIEDNNTYPFMYYKDIICIKCSDTPDELEQRIKQNNTESLYGTVYLQSRFMQGESDPYKWARIPICHMDGHRIMGILQEKTGIVPEVVKFKGLAERHIRFGVDRDVKYSDLVDAVDPF